MSSIIISICLIVILVPFLEIDCKNAKVKKRPLIVQGYDADIKFFPWLAQVLWLDSLICGGVILSDKVVVTAGHCVFDDHDRLRHSMQVYLGSTRVMVGIKYTVCLILPHPKYDPENYYYYDLALLLLHKRIDFNDNVEKGHIAPNTDWRSPESEMIVAGYGKLDTEAQGPSKTLQMTYMSYITNDACNKSYTSFPDGVMNVPDHMFCLIGKWDTGDCHGDSGSGVMWEQYVVGLVSTGRIKECATTKAPSMYTSLTYFQDWIKQSIAELESGYYGHGACKRVVPRSLRNT